MSFHKSPIFSLYNGQNPKKFPPGGGIIDCSIRIVATSMKGAVKSDGAMIGGFHEAVVYFKAEVRTLVTHLVTSFQARS